MEKSSRQNSEAGHSSGYSKTYTGYSSYAAEAVSMKKYIDAKGAAMTIMKKVGALLLIVFVVASVKDIIVVPVGTFLEICERMYTKSRKILIRKV
ncbi:hypothetical protein JTB14_009922 [Gonioctena quinquepunctata]|nr:hypothetical protein JTB14_009922 [Gonioctena quinquepunctata]